LRRNLAIAWLAVLGLLAACVQTPAPQTEATLGTAASESLVISQVYGGGGNTDAPYTHDYIEIFNRGDAEVSLAGLSLQYASATGSGNFGANSGQLTELPSVTLQPGQYYLIQQAGGTIGASLPTPDLVDPTPIAMAAGSGKVALVTGTSGLGCNGGSTPCNETQLARILDLVGYGNANFFEGSAAAPTLSNTTAALRADAGCTDTDNNAADFTAGAPAPRNTATALNPCGGTGGDPRPTVSSTDPDNTATGVALDASITITFSEPVAVADEWYAIACGEEPRTVAAEVSGGPEAYILDPTTDFENNEQCTVTVFADAVTGQNGSMADDFSFSFTTESGPVMIHEIQGTGIVSPRVGETVTVTAVVTAVMEGLSGFYIQHPPEDWDEDPRTSEGIFVFTGSNDFLLEGIAVEDTVTVTAQVGERVTNGVEQTQLQGGINQGITSLTRCADCSSVTILPTKVTFPFDGTDYMERYEGMLVTFPQELVISEYFNFDRFGEVVISLPLEGEDRHYTPTSVVAPGDAANDLLLEYLRRRITLDDGLGSQNSFPARHPDGSVFSVSNSFRGGDTLTNVTGVVDHTFGRYRVQPTTGADYAVKNPRPTQPDDVGGRASVGAFNVLNYFTTIDTGVRICGPSRNQECRGADNAAELERQRTKILAALEGLDADIVGLIEIENTAGVEAEADLVAGLNARMGAGTYDYIRTGTIGTDAIKLALIYKPAAVTPLGDYAILDSSVDPRFDDQRNRPVLAQTFMENATGARITVAVNHLKSKGSACAGDPDVGDGQGNCNKTREAAAQALADWLATDPTGQGDSDALIVGDLNSYAKEDPIRALQDAGYTDLIARFHDPSKSAHPYGYVFDGLFGYLDYAMSSETLTPQITGATEWHINADEPDILDYDTNFNHPSYYAPDAFRSSDHDAVLVGANLAYTPAETLAALRYFIAAYVADGSLTQAQADGLLDKLAALEAALARGQTRAALNQLNAFERQVQAFVRGRSLTQGEGATLLTLAASLRRVL
jgi:uncharacterized protein